MTTPWFRLCLDVDHDGNFRGASYEVHQNDRIAGIYVAAEPGPFDTAEDLMSDLLAHVQERYGVQLRLL